MPILESIRQRLFPRYDHLICELTAQCNLDCLYCYNVWKNEGRPYDLGRELSTDEWKALLDKAREQVRTEVVALSGGEPLLRDDVPEITRFCKSRGMRVNLITNGTRLDDARIEELVEAGVGVFELPLLSWRREVHNALQKGDSFDRITLSMARIRRAGGLAAGVFVATKKNIPDLGDTLRLAHAIGCDGLLLLRFNAGGRGCGNIDELQPSLSALREALATASIFAQTYDFPVFCSIPMQPCLFDRAAYPHLSFGFCSAGTARSYHTVGPTGELRLCNHSPLVLGNLRERSFRDLISERAAVEFKKARPDFCLGCDHADTCQGGCKASAEACYGDLRALEPFLFANRASAIRP